MMDSMGFSILIIGLTFTVAGLLAHFVAENRGRPVWEPWVMTVVTAGLATACMMVYPSPLFVAALAPLPAGAMFLFARRYGADNPLTCPCPHCRDEFVVDPRFGGQPVTCPSCKQLFLGPKVD